MKNIFFLVLTLAFFACNRNQTVLTIQPPGVQEYCKIEVNGESIIPSGRIVKPAGKVTRITHDPFGLAVSPDGSISLAIHNNVLTLIQNATPEKAIRLPDYDGKYEDPFLGKGSYMGAAILRNNSFAWLSGGDSGDIILFSLSVLKSVKRLSINGEIDGKKFVDSFVGDIKLSPDESKLYILDQFNFRLVTVDLALEKVINSVPVGRFPLGLDISPDGKMAYVANTGIYDYPLVPGLNEANIEEKGLDFPPYGVPSKEAEEGIQTDSMFIPGLGSPFVPEAVSIWTIDLGSSTVISKEKTGYRMGEMVEGLEVVGGSSPNSIAAGKEKVFVTNATNDNISVLNPETGKITGTIKLNISSEIDAYRGMIPFGICLSDDGSRLYVALSGLNAVAVVDAEDEKVLGYIPTGWFPTKLDVSPDNKTLFVVTARGFGAGPNGGKNFVVPVQGTYVGDIMLGSYEKVDLTSLDLAQTTRQVINYTFRELPVQDDGKNPLPAISGLRKSPIRHIVYITKENRTFDEIFGELEGADGEPGLAKYGLHATVAKRDKSVVIRNVNLMPNHQKLAREFAISDNFYCDSDASVHGHRWMVGTYPNEWVEINSSMKISQNLLSPAPGRKNVAGSSGAVYPEDYNEAGGMWEHLSRNGINFFNFGLGFEFTGAEEEQWHKYSGVKMGVIYPLPQALYERTSRKYATYNTSIPDQFRIDMFEEELEDKWLSGKEEFPSVITMMIPNDHMSKERTEDGYPFDQSYLVDNDLALGRVIHILSHTKWWKDMLIIVTEDDAQAGVDHVDAHRSILMMISPWVKRNYVSKSHANFGAILKTIYQIMDIPPLNQFDAAATLLQDFFTDQPDFTPYQVEMVDTRIFDPQKALDPYDVNFRWESLGESPEMDNEADFRKTHNENLQKQR